MLTMMALFVSVFLLQGSSGFIPPSSAETFSVIACVLSFVAVIAAFIFIIPEKKQAKLNRAGRIMHNIFNFRSLITEKIYQGLYIFYTAFVIICGFFMLFCSYTDYFGNSHWMGGYGLLLMFFGPFIVRLIFECVMLALLLVKNVISINNKLRVPSNRSNDADRYANNRSNDADRYARGRSYNADRYGNSRRRE